MFGGLAGGFGQPGSGVTIPVITKKVTPWYVGETKTTEGGVTLGGYTPAQCNSQADAQGCCKAYNGYWYQDYGLFAPLYPDKSAEYCHETPIQPLQVPLNQGLLVGGSVAAVIGIVAVLLYGRK